MCICGDGGLFPNFEGVGEGGEEFRNFGVPLDVSGVVCYTQDSFGKEIGGRPCTHKNKNWRAE